MEIPTRNPCKLSTLLFAPGEFGVLAPWSQAAGSPWDGGTGVERVREREIKRGGEFSAATDAAK